MTKLVTDDGRTHIVSALMRESLVDRRVIARTDSRAEFSILPEVTLVGIGGQSIFDRGRDALLPLVEEPRSRGRTTSSSSGWEGAHGFVTPSPSRSTSGSRREGLPSSSGRWRRPTPSS